MLQHRQLQEEVPQENRSQEEQRHPERQHQHCAAVVRILNLLIPGGMVHPLAVESQLRRSITEQEPILRCNQIQDHESQ